MSELLQKIQDERKRSSNGINTVGGDITAYSYNAEGRLTARHLGFKNKGQANKAREKIKKGNGLPPTAKTYIDENGNVTDENGDWLGNLLDEDVK